MIKKMTMHDCIKEWPDSLKDVFSREGLESLFSHLPDDTKYDPFALCLGYKEWDSLEEYIENHNIDDCTTLSDISQNLLVLELSSGRFIAEAY